MYDVKIGNGATYKYALLSFIQKTKITIIFKGGWGCKIKVIWI